MSEVNRSESKPSRSGRERRRQPSRSNKARGARMAGVRSSAIHVRIGQVQELLVDLLSFDYPADATLSRWMRDNRNAGARDRSQVADAAFDVLRHLRRYRQFAESGHGAAQRRLAILGLAQTLGVDALNPALSDDEKQWLTHVLSVDPGSLSRAVRHSLPDWLDVQLSALDDAEALLDTLNQAAPMDIRVNPFKADRASVMTALLDGPDARFDPQVTPYSPWGIRLQGRPPINRWALFTDGQIEVQDEGSQILAALVAPRRNEMVIDYCAGAGGKTLLLGALMRSTGRLYAFDVSAPRLARAKPRFARSGLSNIVPVVIEAVNDKRVRRLKGKAHRVLVDAPCTGLGTLRRNPDLKWRMQPDSLAALLSEQAQILSQASRCVAVGGRLIYATCSVLPQENQQQVERFLAKNPDFMLLEARTILADRCPSLQLTGPYLALRPDRHGTDGFFAAVMQRN